MVSCPADDGFYLPAEWSRHARTWALWPRDENLQPFVSELVTAIQKYEPVSLAAPASEAGMAERLCRGAQIWRVDFGSGQLRDFGPTFLVDGKGGEAAVDWPVWDPGNATTDRMASTSFSHELLSAVEVRRFRAPLTIEDTNFCTDGEGTLLCLAHAVLDGARNHGLEKLSAYDMLCRWLGVSRVIWINVEFSGPEAGRDVRQLCGFTKPGHALVGELPDGPNKDVLDKVAHRLQTARDASGKTLSVTRIPALEVDGHLASYTSFYALNTALLVPQYGDSKCDETACEILSGCFPGRTIEPIDCRELVKRGITLSRMVQYQPARLLDRSKATLLPKSSWQRPVPDCVGLLEEYIAQAEDDS